MFSTSRTVDGTIMNIFYNVSRIGLSALTIFTLTSVSVSSPCEASETSRKYENLPFDKDYLETQALGINDAGTIVGTCINGNESFGQHGYIFKNGTLKKIDIPNRVFTTPQSISNKDDVVGTCALKSDGPNSIPFRMHHGAITFMKRFGVETVPFSINNKGEVVGFFNNGIFSDTAFDISPNGKVAKFRYANSHDIRFTSINSKGEIAATCTKWIGTGNIVCFGVLRKQGKWIELPAPPGALSWRCMGINDSGDIVGEFDDIDKYKHGFVLHGAHFEVLDDPLANHYTSPTSINNNGTIVGYYQDTQGHQHGFITR